MAIRTAICAAILLFISGCSANSYHTNLESPDNNDAKLTELIQAEARAGYLDPFECDNQKSPILSFRPSIDAICASEDLRATNRKIGYSLANIRKSNSSLINGSVRSFDYLPLNLQKATQKIQRICGYNSNRVQCYSELMEHLNDSYSGGPHYSETFSAYSKKKRERLHQERLDRHKQQQLAADHQRAEEERERAAELVETRRSLQSHTDPLAVQFGHCEDIAAIGHEVFCEGSKIASIDEVRDLVLQHGVSKKTGQKYTNLERREMDALLTRTMVEMGTASQRHPGVISKQYGMVLFEIVANIVG